MSQKNENSSIAAVAVMLFFFIVLCLSHDLFFVSESTHQKFTNNVNSNLKLGSKENFTIEQQKTLDNIEAMTSYFLTSEVLFGDNSKKYVELKNNIESHNGNIKNLYITDGKRDYESKNIKNPNIKFGVNINDPSQINLSFFQEGRIEKGETTFYYTAVKIDKLNTSQCLYFFTLFNQGKNMQAKSKYYPDSYDCLSEVNSVEVFRSNRYNDIKSDDVYSTVNYLLNAEYSAFGNYKFNTNYIEKNKVYFSDSKPNNALFFNDVQYMMALHKQNRDFVYMGAVSKPLCKNLQYYLPKNLSLKLYDNPSNECQDVNILVFKKH